MNELVSRVSAWLDEIEPIEVQGAVSQLVGLIVEANGPAASVGDLCEIYLRDGRRLSAEVVGFRENRILLMPLGRLEGICPGDKVVSLQQQLKVTVGEHLLGHVVDGLGRPLSRNILKVAGETRPLIAMPPDPLQRPRIRSVLATGVRAIDGFLTLGFGQRVGIFAGSGVGKSVLLGMIARESEADVNVIALVGERGREVNDFLERDLGPEGLSKSVVVIATSDQPAILRVKCGLTAMAIAEYFRDQGKNVMFMMDSVTRIALSLREIGLAIGEPPTTKAYTPSVFAFLPQLLERAGTAAKGSITGIFTVLVEGSDMEDPIADAVRSILDGHIVLSRHLAEQKQFPAIDILQSISRLMNEIVQPEHLKAANELAALLAIYKNSEDLINIGAYVRGNNKELDVAVEKHSRTIEFLKQDFRDTTHITETIGQMIKLTHKGANT